MTCVVGVVDSGRVHIGADSAGLSGYYLVNRADSKVFKDGGFIYGISGSFRAGQVLQHQFIPPAFDGSNHMAYLVQKFIPALRKVLTEEISEEAATDSPGDFLVGFCGRLFEIDSDLHVGESRCGFAAVGCGREPALGAMTVLRSGKCSPRKAVLAALKVAQQWNAGVRGPFRMVSV